MTLAPFHLSWSGEAGGVHQLFFRVELPWETKMKAKRKVKKKPEETALLRRERLPDTRQIGDSQIQNRPA